MAQHHVPVIEPDHRTVAPMTHLGRWGFGLVVAWVVFALGVFVTPADSFWSLVDVAGGLATGLAAAVVVPVAIFRRGDRSLAVLGAGAVLLVGVLFILLHSLFISD